MALIRVSRKGRLMLIVTAFYPSPYRSGRLYSVIDNRRQETVFETTNKEEGERMLNRLERKLEQ